MARFVLLSLVILVPIVLAAPKEETEKKGRSLILPGGVNTAASGAAGAQYGQSQGGSETHDKKNFGLSFGSDRGSSNQYSNTNAQAGAAGALAQGYGYNPYNPYPYPYPHPYPYPPYPGVGPVVGTGAGVNIPGGVNAGAVGGVIPNGYPLRY